MSAETQITPERISRTEALIRPHIRRTPVLSVDMVDFGRAAFPVQLKLECLQLPVPSRHAAPFPIFCNATSRRLGWSRLRAAMTAQPLLMPPCALAFLQ